MFDIPFFTLNNSAAFATLKWKIQCKSFISFKIYSTKFHCHFWSLKKSCLWSQQHKRSNYVRRKKEHTYCNFFPDETANTLSTLIVVVKAVEAGSTMSTNLKRCTLRERLNQEPVSSKLTDTEWPH